MKVLADSSVWIDHLRFTDASFAALLAKDRLYGHPLVTGEVLMGSLHRRDLVHARLVALPQLAISVQDQVLAFVERYRLFSRGIGYVDANLLFSCLEARCRLLTRDTRLADAADELGLRFTEF